MPFALLHYAEEVASWATAEELEAALETAFAELFDLSTLGDDLNLPMPPPGLQGEGVAR